MTTPPSSPSALSSGALADEVRDGEAVKEARSWLAGLSSEWWPGNTETDWAHLLQAVLAEHDAALAQLVARLEQAERERTTYRARWHEAERAYSGYGEILEDLTQRLAVCEHTRDDALAALHYIKQQYGPLDGVGWNRLTGEKA